MWTALGGLLGGGPSNTVQVKSSQDNRVYKVQNLPDKQSAANMMSDIRINIEKLIDSYKRDPNTSADPRIKALVERFNPDNLSENDLNADSTSYSENKGEKIVVCLRDKSKPNKPLVDLNTVMFVILHEMAHLMTTTIGHTPEFWANFKRILLDASSLGIYNPINYNKFPTNYCGMTITDTPI